GDDDDDSDVAIADEEDAFPAQIATVAVQAPPPAQTDYYAPLGEAASEIFMWLVKGVSERVAFERQRLDAASSAAQGKALYQKYKKFTIGQFVTPATPADAGDQRDTSEPTTQAAEEADEDYAE